jgi:hypothetical protein
VKPRAPRDLIRACADLREPERRRLLALDDWTLHALHVEWSLPDATTARVAAGLRDGPVSFDNVKHYRVVLEGRRAPTQSAEQTAGRRPPPSGEERRRGHVDQPRLVPSDAVGEMPDPVPATKGDYAMVANRQGEYRRERLRRAASKR